MKGLFFKAEWIQEIFKLTKSVELRNGNWYHRGLVALVQGGKVLGVVRLIDSWKYNSVHAAWKDAALTGVRSKIILKELGGKTGELYGLKFGEVLKFKGGVKVKFTGSRKYVTFSEDELSAITAAIKEARDQKVSLKTKENL